MRGFLALSLLGSLLAQAPLGAGANPIEGIVFATPIRSQEAELELHRSALMRWKGLFDVYAAALYLGTGVTADEVLSEVPRRLEISYLRDFSAEQFRRATLEGVKRNVDRATFVRVQPGLDALNALYRDVSEGDRYALTYLPGVGTELALNGESLGRVGGREVSRAIFSIWLGPHPIDDRLKRNLLDVP